MDGRDKLIEAIQKRQDKSRSRLWEANEDSLLKALMGSNPPTEVFIKDSATKGLIDPRFAFTIIREREAEARTEEREARYEAGQANAEADAVFDGYISGIVAERTTGDLQGADPQSDKQLLESGRLGTGLKALTRYQRLRAAARAGEQQNLSNPEVALYAGKLRREFGQKLSGGMALLAGREGGAINFYGMLGYYRHQVAQGMNPATAYNEAVLKYAPKAPGTIEAAKARLEELKAKKAAARR